MLKYTLTYFAYVTWVCIHQQDLLSLFFLCLTETANIFQEPSETTSPGVLTVCCNIGDKLVMTWLKLSVDWTS